MAFSSYSTLPSLTGLSPLRALSRAWLNSVCLFKEKANFGFCFALFALISQGLKVSHLRFRFLPWVVGWYAQEPLLGQRRKKPATEELFSYLTKCLPGAGSLQSRHCSPFLSSIRERQEFFLPGRQVRRES